METDYRLVGKKIVPLMLNWARTNLRVFPWREEITPYRVFIAEMLLKRTTATAVSKFYNDFLSQYPSITALSKANITNLESLLKRLGLQKIRAKTLYETSKYIADNYNSIIPDNKNELMKIPYIGPYSAGAILSMGYNIPAIMVDSNAIRFYSRLFGTTANIKIISRIAEEIMPYKEHSIYNLSVLDIGALICRNKNPKCTICPIKQFCKSSGKPNYL